ncbi:MAG TPA: hypothetical protein VEV84_02090 [Pyrinomonadaceae bacterium]|nr:hypothetical protein [Pyrinomonadaceae bacterium]
MIDKKQEGEAGRLTITKFNGDKDFSEATIAINFSVLKSMDKPQDAEIMVPNFKKYDGLFGKNGEILRLAETFGHEAGHAVYALDHTADAVADEKSRAQFDQDVGNLPKKHRYPLPPDLQARATANGLFHDKTEVYAQTQEKIINGELRAYDKMRKK